MITNFKIFEKYDYSEYKKYCLIRYNERIFVIARNLGNEFKKIYNIINGELELMNINMCFTMSSEEMKNDLLFESDDINEVLDNVDLYINAKKYNL